MSKKQDDLPGMESRDMPEIEQAAERYRNIRDQRCALSKQESEAKSALIQVMLNKRRSFYSYNGLVVQLSKVENVKVKSKDEDDEPIGRFSQPMKAITGDGLEFMGEFPSAPQMGSEESVAAFFGGNAEAQEWNEAASAMIEEAEAEHEVMAQSIEDDFTAPLCPECRRIDGAHTDTCSKRPHALTFEDYLDFVQNGCERIKNPNTQARKWQLSKEIDSTIIKWKRMKAEGKLPGQQQQGDGKEAKPKPKGKRKSKLDPVEEAIDR